MTHLDVASKYVFIKTFLNLKFVVSNFPFFLAYSVLHMAFSVLCFININDCFLLFRVSIDFLSSEVREWSQRIGNVRKNVKKADDDLKNLMSTFLKVKFLVCFGL